MNANDPDSAALANRLHSAAIHLLRSVSRRDPESGLTAARLSALSVLAFGGPRTISALAAAEGVQVPTMSRLLAAMEAEGLVRREVDTADRRVVRVHATERGRDLLREARIRRIEDLAQRLESLSAEDRAALSRAAEVLEHLFGSPAPR